MMLVFHRDENGKIIRCYDSGKFTESELRESIASYNETHTDKADYVGVEDDELLAYLYRRVKENIKLRVDLLRDLHNTLQDAESYAYELLCEAEKEK